MRKGFTLLLFAVMLIASAITPILAQDFAFGGANSNNRNSVIRIVPGLTNLGVTGAATNLTLNTLTGVGNGRLANGRLASTSFNAVDVGIGDVDGDGINDLVGISDDTNGNINALAPIPSPDAGIGRITLFTGAGDGTFGLPVSTSTRLFPTSLAIADTDLDGVDEMVVADGTGYQIFNSGNLIVAVSATIPLAGITFPVSVSVERIDDDALPDIVVASTFLIPNAPGCIDTFVSTLGLTVAASSIVPQGAIASNSQGIFILGNRAVSAFQSNIPFPVVGGAVDTDFDIGIATTAGLEVFENLGTDPGLGFLGFDGDLNNGQPNGPVVLAAGSAPIAFLPGDVNGDNVADLNVLNFGSGTTTTYVANAGNVGYQTARTSVAGSNPISGTLANFDGDNNADLLIADIFGIVFLQGNGNGSFTNLGENVSSFFGFPANASAVASDVVNLLLDDGIEDIAIADGFAGPGLTGGIIYLDSQGGLPAGFNPVGLRLFTAVSLAADFDGTGGLNDIAVMEQRSGTVFVLLNLSSNANPTLGSITLRDIFTNRDIRPTSATSFVDALTGLNDIAITDVATPQNTNGAGQIIVGLNDGTGRFSNQNGLFRQFVATSGATNILSGDFRNTGRATDLVYVDYLNNLAAVALNDGTNFFLTPQIRETGGFVPVSAALADVNDDDNLDVMVLNSGAAPNQTVGNQSIVSVLLGQGDGRLIPTGSLLNVSNSGLSIVGGLAVLDTSPIRRVVDFNNDGFPDFAVNGTRGGAGVLGVPGQPVPTVTLLLNRPDAPGQFVVQPPISLFDDTVSTGGGNAVNGANMALDSTVGGPGLVTGRGGNVNAAGALVGLTTGFGGAGVGGANYTLSVSDFQADGSPDLVVTGSFNLIQNVVGPVTNVQPVNYRAAIYLVGNQTAGTMRVSRPMRIREFTLNTVGTLTPRSNGGDTFVACTTGNFSPFNNLVPDVVHLSINGGLYIDGNITSVLNHAPIVRINRTDLGAPMGQGRKVILTSGQMRSIPVTGADVDVPGDRLSFSLVPPPNGEAPPSFVRIMDNGNNTANVVVDTRNNGAGVNNGPGQLRARIAVQATDAGTSGPGGRLPLIGRDFFTLVVNPNSAPTIAPIANVSLEAGRTQTVNLQVNDREGDAVTISSKCDKDSFVSVSGTTLSIAPTDADVGTNTCTLTATDSVGLFSTTSFVITVRARNIAPTIANIGDQTVRQGQVITVNVTANDTPGDALRLSITSPLAFATLSDNGNGTGVIRIAPALTDAQGGRITVNVTDQGGLSASTSFNVTVQTAVQINGAAFDTRGKQLFINGTGFGTSGARVTINGQDVTARVSGQSNESITAKGNKKKLNLRSGPNQIVVTSGGVTSNTFVLNLLQGSED